VEDASGDETHDHVSSVETIHAVDSKYSLLQLYFRDSGYFRFITLGQQSLYSLVNLEMAVAQTDDGFFHVSDQLGEVIPTSLSLSVEVEPSILHLGIVVLSNNLSELLADLLLAILLVDKIHEVDLIIVLLQRLDVVIVGSLVLEVILLDEK